MKLAFPFQSIAPLYVLAACLVAHSLTVNAEPLPEAKRTNGEDTLLALKSLPHTLSQCLVTLELEDGSAAMRGVIVGAPGYFITKATEVPFTASFKVRWTDGSMQIARVVHRDVALDLVLCHASTAAGMPIAWSPSSPLSTGQWLCSPVRESSHQDWRMQLGVFSAKRREVQSKGPALGVTMEEVVPKNNGVRIVQVASDGPAELAGITLNDLLVAVNGQPVVGLESVKEIIRECQVGQEVRVNIQRNGKLREMTLRLASKTKVISNWDGEDYGNGGVSLRTDGYPQIIQHDIPLRPNDMGTPLLDVLGNAVGLNISRVDRVTTFALPTEVFSSKVMEWIVADQRRQAPDKEPRSITVKRAIVPAQ